MSLLTPVSPLALLGLTLGAVYSFGIPAQAQVTSDGTLPTPTVVTGAGNFTITGGTPAGINLFHSFSDFSLTAGQSATFVNNSAAVQNVVGRVTGGNPSDIAGTIAAGGANPNFNLFLINPAGVIFRNGASLNLNGSFTASTATSLSFAGGVFSTDITTSAAPGLLINTPLGLQLGPSSGSVQITGTGLNPVLNVGNNTLALIGNGVDLSGGFSTAAGGRIEVGSVGANSTVDLTPIAAGFQAGYSTVQNFQDIQASQGASLSADGGDIQIVGNNVTFDTGARASVNPTITQAGGLLTVTATGTLTLDGNSGAPLFSPSGFFAQNLGGAQNAGDIAITARQAIVSNGALIFSSTVGAGAGGDVSLTATERVLLAGVNTGIFSQSILGASGAGGQVAVTTPNLVMQNGARISANAMGSGDTGNVTLTTGQTTLANQSEVTIDNTGTGTSGEIAVIANAGSVNVENQSRIAARTTAGTGGNLRFRVRDNVILRFNSEISTEALGAGDGGTINFDVGGYILAVLPENSDVVATALSGNGGTITGNASGIYGFRELQDGLRTPESDFTATSGTGLDGIIDIQVQEPPENELEDPGLFEDAIARGCDVAAATSGEGDRQSSFVDRGNGGLAPQAGGLGQTENLMVPLGDPVVSQSLGGESPETAISPLDDQSFNAPVTSTCSNHG